MASLGHNELRPWRTVVCLPPIFFHCIWTKVFMISRSSSFLFLWLQMLMTHKAIQIILGLILAFGNYMNGGKAGISTLRRNRRHSADDIFKCIFLNENVWIQIKISLKFIPKAPINNIPTLVLITAWRRPGAKPLSEPVMIILLMHIYVTQPQWV